MKKIIILLALCLPLYSLCQQKNVYDTAAEKMCEYMNKYADKLPSNMTGMETFFAKAFVEVCGPYLERLMQVEGMTSLDEGEGRKIGVNLGLKLAVMCPLYMEVIQVAVKSKNESSDEEKGTLSGTVTGITQETYTYVKLRSADGTQKRIVWLLRFEGAENFDNDPQKLVGKKVNISWKAVQLYYPKSNSFGKEKIITEVEIE